VGGVPPAAATVLARQCISLATLKDYPVEWAVACLVEERVTLSQWDWQQLASVIAPGASSSELPPVMSTRMHPYQRQYPIPCSSS
jgi:hypothetical protein